MNSELSDAQAQLLHDKYTRGDTLSTEEHIQLEHWYERQDKLEASQLGLATEAKNEPDLALLKAQVDIALLQLSTVSSQIQTVSAENEALRQETEQLRHHIVHMLASQSI